MNDGFSMGSPGGVTTSFNKFSNQIRCTK